MISLAIRPFERIILVLLILSFLFKEWNLKNKGSNEVWESEQGGDIWGGGG